MKNYDKNIIPSYLMYLDAKNLYGWLMCQKLPVNGFQWIKSLSKFDESFIKSYDENSNKGYFLEADVEFLKKLFNLHKDFSFLPEREKIGKREKLICNIRERKICCSHKSFTAALNHGLILKSAHRVIQFNQKAWLKPYIDMNTKLRKEAKNEFEEDFFKLMNNAVFGKTMGNVRKHRDIKLVTTDKRRYQLVSEPNYRHSKLECR